MQTEDSGTSLPRKEGMEEFYGNPKDMERAKDFTVKKEGDVFAVKDEKGKTIRTFKQENEANKFKENYGLGIVGNVAKSLFKQEPKMVGIETAKSNEYYIGDSPKYADGTGVEVFNNTGDVVAEFDTKKEANKFIADKSNSTQHSIDITPELKAQVREGLPQFSKGGRDVQPVVNMIKESQDEGELTDKEIAETLEQYFPKEDIQAAFDLINNPTENEPTITESSEFTPSAKDIAAFEKILGTTSGAIRNKNIAEAAKENPKIKEIMDNFEELKKQLMDKVELTEECSW
jgi:hypothetical protein